MIRRAFTMRLKPDALVEYKHHHDHIWPELVAEIEQAGIASITTFQRDLDLFLVSEIADEAAWDKLWNSDVHKRWAQVMDPLMQLREDGIVDAGPLTEVFHLTTNGHLPVSATVILEPPHEPAAPPAKHVRKVASPPAKKTAGKKTKHPKKAAAKKSTKKAAKPAKAKAAKKAVKKAPPKKAKKSAKKKKR